jgi:hypothetical protein
MGMDFGQDGSLVAVFQANNTFPYQVGIAKFDRAGKLLWRHDDFSHHWPTVGPDGQIYTPYMKLATNLRFAGGTRVPIECKSNQIYLEGVRVLGPDGTVRHEFNLADGLLKSDYPGLLYGIRDGCDHLHANGISLLNVAAAVKLGAKAGDLLVSLRSSSALVVIDQSTGEVRKVIFGRSVAQHSPFVLPDGNILVFGNLGGERSKGGSRVLWIDSATNEARSIFPGTATRGASLYSDTRGVVDVSPDGKRILVTSSREGRVIEADIATGEALWSFDNVMDFDSYLKPRKIKSQAHNARLIVNGAYYVSADFMGGIPAR